MINLGNRILLISILLFSLLTSCEEERPIIMGMELPEGIFALIETNKGNILCRLEYKKAPLTVSNFVGLSEGSIANPVNTEGACYYNGILWHRVDAGFVIQAGDPNTLPFYNAGRVGTGGPGYQFRNEISGDLRHNVQGTLAMANSGPNTNGSQFYITHVPTPQLDGGYNVFGYVSRGMGTVNAIRKNDTIRTVKIYRVGSEAKKFDAKKTFESLK
ncbi:MAG: peptidylprolyl isomerase [Bacteroidia bacterium]|nr:peptidylprolyl isomerase [Bacteroidia bacterium]